ncbi:serine/threonine protein kinase [bacterium]|nr:serine/threonine protein kinase [bacterium]
MLDTYRIERVLGEGGFGVTYLVTELNLGKEYAIKELIPDGVAIRQGGTTVMARSSSMEEDFEATRRHFIKEARVLATLKHPAIVAVHRLFEANGTCYMVMDYVEGETLGAYLKRQGGMLGSREEFEGIFYPIMDGLEVLHGKEMIHRDIKPGNIMVTPDGSPVLLDFGASCRVENHTVTMTQMVSAGYSPFEQYTTRAKQGPYTDIYALGATMVRAITGAKPDDATDRMDEDHYQPLRERKDLLGLYGSDFLVAVDRALLLRKGDRPQSVGEWRKMMKTGGGAAALEVVPDSKIGIPEDKRPKLSPNRQPDVLDKAVVGDEKSEVVVRETGKKRLTLGVGVGLLVALGVIMYVTNDRHSEAEGSSSTRVVVLDSKDTSQFDLIDTIPGTYLTLDSLVRAYLERGGQTPHPRASFPYDSAYSSYKTDVSWVQPLHRYYLSASSSPDGSSVILRFLGPAYHYFDQPGSAARWQYYHPLEKTIQLHFPKAKQFYYEIEGKGRFEASDFASLPDRFLNNWQWSNKASFPIHDPLLSFSEPSVV